MGVRFEQKTAGTEFVDEEVTFENENGDKVVFVGLLERFLEMDKSYDSELRYTELIDAGKGGYISRVLRRVARNLDQIPEFFVTEMMGNLHIQNS